MVFFNYATMQMAAKIVYYGPGLCGKTTNLHWIYSKTSPLSRGEMVSLETETDRTLFFDLLPIDVGVIGGFKTRLQLYTIPGQVFYNTTRKLVLKGVDGLVFVSDSQKAMLEANAESFKNLRENLKEIGLNLDDIPLVIQLNKRDLPNIADKEAMLDLLDPEGKYEFTEASAVAGVGVFETLKQISKLTLRTLRRRMTGEPARLSVRHPRGDVPEVESTFGSVAAEERAQASAVAVAPPPLPRGDAAPASPVAIAAATPQATAAVEVSQPQKIGELDPIDELAEEELAPFDEAASYDASLDARILAGAEEINAAPGLVPPPPREPEVDFVQTEKPAKAAPEVKHVKVRSSVDIMAELEALRKRATGQPRVKKDSSAAAPQPRAEREVQRSVELSVPSAVVARAKSARVTVSFVDEKAGLIHSEDRAIEIDDGSDVQKLLLNLKIDVS
jgi:mutual gliding-motility protein MglA